MLAFSTIESTNCELNCKKKFNQNNESYFFLYILILRKVFHVKKENDRFLNVPFFLIKIKMFKMLLCYTIPLKFQLELI